MILTLDEYKQYLPLQTIQNYNATITESHETRALYKWMKRYLGAELVEQLADNELEAELLLKVKPALANFAYLEALPFLNLVLTGAGFGIVSNPNMAPASTDRIKALAAALLEAANNFLDAMLVFLEKNTATYTTWNQCSLNPGSIITTADEFDARLKINNSRVTFINLIPHIKEVEVLHVANILSDEFLSELILGNDNNVKPLIQYSVAFMAWDNMMNSKQKGNDPVLIYSQKEMLQANRPSSGWDREAAGFMAQAISYLNKNLDSYLTYKENAYEAPLENKPENGFYIT